MVDPRNTTNGAPPDAPALQVRGLRVGIPSGGEVVYPVDGVDLHVATGESVAVIGESGSGKTTLALAAMGLLSDNGSVMTGEVIVGGRNLVGASEGEWERMRGTEVAMVFQDPAASLNPVIRVGPQIRESITTHDPKAGGDALRQRVLDLLVIVGLRDSERVYRSYPHQLSGGMRQRAMIAVAMANRPRLLIADEPTTALDVCAQAQVLAAIKTMQRQTGSGLLFITHDLGIVWDIADRVVIMYGGRIVETGAVDDIVRRPLHPYTKGLLALAPRPDRVEMPCPEQLQEPGTGLAAAPSTLGAPSAPKCARRSLRNGGSRRTGRQRLPATTPRRSSPGPPKLWR
jgi:ABC-type dipeptide/oligopeptide/nickel transport system ATPase component